MRRWQGFDPNASSSYCSIERVPNEMKRFETFLRETYNVSVVFSVFGRVRLGRAREAILASDSGFFQDSAHMRSGRVHADTQLPGYAFACPYS